MIRILSVLGLMICALPSWAAEPVGIPTVTDGDTLAIHGSKIRLHGIDAPESRQYCQDQKSQSYPCGRQAAFALADLVKDKTVRCEQRNMDRYGRIIAVCYLGQQDLNETLVRQGHAVAYRRYSKDYVKAEEEAKRLKIGIWQGAFLKPEQFRRQLKKPKQSR